MPAYLDAIVAAHRAQRDSDERVVAELVDAALEETERRRTAEARSFVGSIRTASEQRGMAVISEIKRRSPSKGALALDLDPADVARSYEEGGAACLSVLTDEAFFGGSEGDLRAARGACGLPVLRKDFTVGPADVCDARLMGADAVLLIAAVLDDIELTSLIGLAAQFDLDALVEVHDHLELERALHSGATLIGVNQRDLRTFEVDGARAKAVGAAIPAGVVSVAESGIRDGVDVAELAEVGFAAVLVGETLVTSGDRGGAVEALLAQLPARSA